MRDAFNSVDVLEETGGWEEMRIGLREAVVESFCPGRELTDCGS
jgi:hypothetical protein